MIKLSRILVPADFSELSVHSMLYVRSFAEAYGADVHMLHVVDEAYQYWMALGPNSLPIGPPPEELVAGSRSQLDRFVKEHLSDTEANIVKEVVLGRPFLEIIRYARQHTIDLIIMGTHGRGGLTQALLGSVAEKVVRKAPCPVLTIRHPQHEFVMP